MQRFVNDPDYVVEDMLKGFLKAHGDLVVKSEANDRVVKYINTPVEGKVGLVTGAAADMNLLFLAMSERIWWMLWQSAKFSLRRPPRHSMTHLWRRTLEKAWPVCLETMPETT